MTLILVSIHDGNTNTYIFTKNVESTCKLIMYICNTISVCIPTSGSTNLVLENRFRHDKRGQE